jgi:hypothetical protein
MLIILLIIGSLIISTNTVVSDENVKTINESIEISEPVIEQQGDYIIINFDESTSFMNKPGFPLLPVLNKVYTLPFGSRVNKINVEFSEFKELKTNKDIKIVDIPEPLISQKIKTDSQKSAMSNYDNTEIYPTDSFKYRLGSGLNDGTRVLYLSIFCYPIKYKASENKLYYSDKVDIKFEYQNPVSSSNSNDECDMVIIAPSSFSETLQPLVDHKNSNNLQTIVKTKEEILGSYPGRDDPEQIKYFIKEAIDTMNAKYILLIGDMDYMPMRKTAIEMWDDVEMPTDLYYADIFDSAGEFCTWDLDNDDKFGEYDWREGDLDGLDLYPDIKVGRIPCKNKFELKTVIGKIITYETQTYGSKWFNNAVLMGGDTFPNHGPIEGEMVTAEVANQIPQFDSTFLWTSENNYNPFIINREISKGAGFISYSGHGYEMGFGTSKPNVENRIEYYTPYTLGMLNHNKFPIIFFDACLTAKLDYNFFGIKLPCFAWYLIKKPIGGAVATIGATRVAFTMVDNNGIHGGAGFLNVHFFKAYEPGTTVSDMLVSTQNDYINIVEWRDCITLEEFVLFGDPSLKIGGYQQNQGLKVKIVNSEIDSIINTPIYLSAETNGGTSPYNYFWDLDEDKSFDDATGQNIQVILNSKGAHLISVKVVDANNNQDIYNTVIDVKTKAEKPFGPTDAREIIEYTFSANNNQPNWKEVYYLVDWGDGSMSNILGPYDSDETAVFTHSWNSEGSYKIKIKNLLINSNGDIHEETGWSDPLVLTVSKSRSITSFHPLFRLLSQIFPNLFSFLNSFY